LAVQGKALGTDSHAVSLPLQHLAALRNANGDLEEARRMYRRAMEIREKALGAENPDLAWVLRPYGYLLTRLGEMDQARQTLERALTISEQAWGPDHLEYALSLSGLGFHEYAQGNLETAREIFEKSLEIQHRALGSRSRRIGTAYYNLTCISALQGRRNEALRYLREAFDVGWTWAGVFEDSDLDSLRGDPEFEAMMEEMQERLDERQRALQ
jgi:tetratricopeptide (TPR) repeat protein